MWFPSQPTTLWEYESEAEEGRETQTQFWMIKFWNTKRMSSGKIHTALKGLPHSILPNVVSDGEPWYMLKMPETIVNRAGMESECLVFHVSGVP